MKVFSRRIVIGVALSAALAGGFLALRPAAVSVEVERTRRGPMRLTVEEEGRTRVRQRFVLSTPAAGRLRRIVLREGDSVAEGAVVAILDPLPLDERARAQAHAALERAKAARRASEARVRQAKESYEQAWRDRQRAEVLAKQGLRSPGEREQAVLLEATRAHDFEAAKFSEHAAAFDVEAARAVLIADQAGGVSAAIGIRTPITGRVLRVNQESERSLPAGSPVLEIGDPGDLELVVDLLSTDAVRVSPGASMTIDGGDGRLLRGHVRLVEPAAFTKISALGVEEQRVNVIGDLDEPAGRMGDGFRVEVAITLWASADVLRVSTAALFRERGSWSVFLVERGRARRRAVDIGHRNPTEAEILRGIDPGAVVIVHPGETLTEGSRVRILQ